MCINLLDKISRTTNTFYDVMSPPQSSVKICGRVQRYHNSKKLNQVFRLFLCQCAAHTQATRCDTHDSKMYEFRLKPKKKIKIYFGL